MPAPLWRPSHADGLGGQVRLGLNFGRSGPTTTKVGRYRPTSAKLSRRWPDLADEEQIWQLAGLNLTKFGPNADLEDAPGHPPSPSSPHSGRPIELAPLRSQGGVLHPRGCDLVCRCGWRSLLGRSGVSALGCSPPGFATILPEARRDACGGTVAVGQKSRSVSRFELIRIEIDQNWTKFGPTSIECGCFGYISANLDLDASTQLGLISINFAPRSANCGRVRPNLDSF